VFNDNVSIIITVPLSNFLSFYQKRNRIVFYRTELQKLFKLTLIAVFKTKTPHIYSLIFSIQTIFHFRNELFQYLYLILFRGDKFITQLYNFHLCRRKGTTKEIKLLLIEANIKCLLKFPILSIIDRKNRFIKIGLQIKEIDLSIRHSTSKNTWTYWTPLYAKDI